MFLLFQNAVGQKWQQTVHYNIEATLNEKEKSITGFETVTYFNNSPDTLNFIWFHLWPNAYKNDQTAFSNQLLAAGKTDFYFADKEQRGYINRLQFKVDGATARVEDHHEHIDIVKVLLPVPLLPGKQAQITTPFYVKLPFNFSRSGYDGNTFQVTQWFPKAALYDADGWHPMPYLHLGEYYSNFGRYDVTLTVPQHYVVAATGQLQNGEELQWLKGRKDYVLPKQVTVKKSYAAKSKTTRQQPRPITENKIKTLYYLQDSVHDFAWFANPHFIVEHDTCLVDGGNIIDVYTYYTPSQKSTWKKSLAFTKDALRFYSSEIGTYPYKTMSVVQGPASFGGGMEYPTITVLSPVQVQKDLDVLIAHETGHNWFQGMLASNERAHPWMDEGFNSFYERKYTAQKYGPQPQWEKLLFLTTARQHKDQAIANTSETLTATNYMLSSYYKTAEWLRFIEQQMGERSFQRMMQEYFENLKFQHPQPKDFKTLLQKHWPGTDAAWQYLHQTGLLPHQELNAFQVITPFRPATFQAYLLHPKKHTLLVLPAVGYNKYDGLMIGGLFSNYKLPPAKLQYVAVPLYATDSKQWNGIGQIQYSHLPNNNLQRIDLGILGARFSKNHHLDSNGQKVFETFYKISPSVKVTFKSNIKNSQEKWIEARTYLIGEKDFSHFTIKSTDSLFYVDSFRTTNRYINQLTYQVTDYRSLYPYHYQWQLQQGKGFYRLNFTGNYFFNYAGGGGANVRWFGAHFGTFNKKKNSFAHTLYQPKLLGVTGEEDFTYSNYFVGRSASFGNDATAIENSGIGAQQIMIRDGGFKMRLDQFEFLQGRSANWVAALNFNTSFPKQLLPFKNPLKAFLDVGTFAEAWEKDASISRFLFVGGLQMSLFKNVINIYAPLVYSSDFKNNLKAVPDQNTFFKKLTFSIDVNQLSLKKLTNNQFSF